MWLSTLFCRASIKDLRSLRWCRFFLSVATKKCTKYTSIIHDELNKLGLEFARYKERWDKLARSIQTVNKDVESVSITADKITKKFETINKVEVNKLENSTIKELSE